MGVLSRPAITFFASSAFRISKMAILEESESFCLWTRSNNLPETQISGRVHRDEDVVADDGTEGLNLFQQEERELFRFHLVDNGDSVKDNDGCHVVHRVGFLLGEKARLFLQD